MGVLPKDYLGPGSGGPPPPPFGPPHLVRGAPHHPPPSLHHPGHFSVDPSGSESGLPFGDTPYPPPSGAPTLPPHHPAHVGPPPTPPPPPPPGSALTPTSMAPPLSSSGDLSGSGSVPPPLCAGCRLRIVDKYYLCAVDSKWHTSCLKCAECGVELENQVSCFERDGQMYCKEDYVRIFTSKCFRCLSKLSSQDLVMRVGRLLFHVDCFRCSACDIPLKKGDLFGMVDDAIFCQAHYESHAPPPVVSTGGPTTVPPPPPSFTSSDAGVSHHSPTSGGPPDPFHPHHHHPGAPGMYGGPGGQPPFGVDGLPPPPPGWFGFGGIPGGPDGSTPPGSGDFPPYDNNNEPRLKKQRGRKKRKVETGSAFAAINGYLDAASAAAAAASGGAFPVDGNSKTKRARTSFKHHQLRIMKAHFQINQNPDSRELKMLSQKTQLDKKVLQVWFQNARAKWRRTKAQDGTGNPAGMISGSQSIPPAPASSSSGLSGPEDGLDGLGGPVSPCSDDVSASDMDLRHDTMLLA